jgi:hypothetical protein
LCGLSWMWWGEGNEWKEEKGESSRLACGWLLDGGWDPGWERLMARRLCVAMCVHILIEFIAEKVCEMRMSVSGSDPNVACAPFCHCRLCIVSIKNSEARKKERQKGRSSKQGGK